MENQSDFTPKAALKVSWVELSKRLGYSRRAIYNWREMPDAPPEPDPIQWQAFIESHGLGQKETKSLTELKAEVEGERLRKLRRENEVAEGQIVQVDDMVDFLRGLGAKWDMMLTQKIEVEFPPKLLGLSIAEIRAECRRAHDEIRDITHNDLTTWSPTNDK